MLISKVSLLPYWAWSRCHREWEWITIIWPFSASGVIESNAINWKSIRTSVAISRQWVLEGMTMNEKRYLRKESIGKGRAKEKDVDGVVSIDAQAAAKDQHRSILHRHPPTDRSIQPDTNIALKCFVYFQNGQLSLIAFKLNASQSRPVDEMLSCPLKQFNCY